MICVYWRSESFIVLLSVNFALRYVCMIWTFCLFVVCVLRNWWIMTFWWIWKLKANYVWNTFHDSSLTFCELFLLLIFLLVTWSCFTNLYYAVCWKSDMHLFVHNELVYKFWWLLLEYKEWNRFKHHCCAQKERGSEERDSSKLSDGNM